MQEIYHYLMKVSLTAGPAFGYGRPPSLDIVTSAWIDMGVSYGSKVWKQTFLKNRNALKTLETPVYFKY